MECASKKFELGWLMRQCHLAHIHIMADYNPLVFKHWPQQTARPIPASEAQEVFEVMDARFKEWTGLTLAEHLVRSSIPGQPETS